MKIQETEVSSNIFSSWEDYTPAQLRVIAAEMERDGYTSVNMRAEQRYGDAEFVCCAKRMETESEAIMREQREADARKQRENWDRQNYERLRKQFEGKQ